MEKTFSFTAGSLYTRVAIADGGLTITRGTESGRVIALSKLLGFYVIVEPTLRRQYLILKSDEGIERLRGTTQDSAELDALANELAVQRPEADFRSLPIREGLRRLGASDGARWRYLVAPLAAAVVLALAAPQLLMLARPIMQVSAGQLATLPNAFRRYDVEAHADVDRALEVTWKEVGASGHKGWLVPLVDGDAPPAAFMFVDDDKLASVGAERVHTLCSTSHVGLLDDFQRHAPPYPIAPKRVVLDDRGELVSEALRAAALAFIVMVVLVVGVQQLNRRRRNKPAS